MVSTGTRYPHAESARMLEILNLRIGPLENDLGHVNVTDQMSASYYLRI